MIANATTSPRLSGFDTVVAPKLEGTDNHESVSSTTVSRFADRQNKNPASQ